MRDLLEQIRKGLDNNLYYLSLFVALSLPDICGAMNSTNGEACKYKYVDWFDRYVAGKYICMLDGEDCYRFRCSLLHQGSSQHPRSTYSRIIFVEPTATTSVFHRNVLNDALNIDVRIFCNDIIEGVAEWLDEVENTALYQRNYSKFMMRYPNGLEPYIVGVPVIA
jgi:hypothetical protein